ncbi:MAG: hypothetical protein V4685_11315 [Bacteroidota bacterium]
METERIWILIARKFADEASEADIEELEILLKADPLLDEMTSRLFTYVNKHVNVEVDPIKLNRVFEKIKTNNEQHETDTCNEIETT